MRMGTNTLSEIALRTVEIYIFPFPMLSIINVLGQQRERITIITFRPSFWESLYCSGI
eukprot:gene1262-720_t